MADRRIIVLEDEPIIAWDIEAELQSRGFVVAGVAGHVDAAMALLEAGGIGAAILDINVGDTNSYGVARACIARGIPVVFLTGHIGDARPDDLTDCAIIAKPMTYDDLVAQLERALDGAAPG